MHIFRGIMREYKKVGLRMGRLNRSQEKRKEIIDAFNRCLEKQSIENISVREIAREANIPVGSLNYYFNSKNEVVVAAYQQIFDQYIQLYLKWVDEIDPTICTQKQFLESFFSFTKAYFNIDNLLAKNRYARFMRTLTTNPDIREMYNTLNKQVIEIVSAGIKKTRYRPENPQLLACLLLALLDGTSVFSQICCDSFEREDLMKCLFSLVV